MKQVAETILFETCDEAVQFLTRQGEPSTFTPSTNLPCSGFKNIRVEPNDLDDMDQMKVASQYSHNFLSYLQEREIREKEPWEIREWDSPSFGDSHWFQSLTYHGDKEVIQHGPKKASS